MNRLAFLVAAVSALGGPPMAEALYPEPEPRDPEPEPEPEPDMGRYVPDPMLIGADRDRLLDALVRPPDLHPGVVTAPARHWMQRDHRARHWNPGPDDTARVQAANEKRARKAAKRLAEVRRG